MRGVWMSQRKGIQFLFNLYSQGLGGILGDDMVGSAAAPVLIRPRHVCVFVHAFESNKLAGREEFYEMSPSPLVSRRSGWCFLGSERNDLVCGVISLVESVTAQATQSSGVLMPEFAIVFKPL